MLGAVAVGAADEQDVLGLLRGRDPGLLAVDHVAAVAALGEAGEVGDVRARLGLGHRDRLDIAGRDAAEDLLLLLLGAVALVGAGDDHRESEGAGGNLVAADLLEQQDEVDGAAAGSAVFLGNRHSEPAEVGHLLGDLGAVILLAAVGQRGALLTRSALALAEVANRLDEVVLLVSQLQWHRCYLLVAAAPRPGRACRRRPRLRRRGRCCAGARPSRPRPGGCRLCRAAAR